jgi:hypothetical protein
MVQTTCKPDALYCNTIHKVLLVSSTYHHLVTYIHTYIHAHTNILQEYVEHGFLFWWLSYMVLLLATTAALFRFRALSSSLRIDPNTSAQYLTIV